MKLSMYVADNIDRGCQFKHNWLLQEDLSCIVAYGLDFDLGELKLLVRFETEEFLNEDARVDLLFCHEQSMMRGFNLLYIKQKLNQMLYFLNFL